MTHRLCLALMTVFLAAMLTSARAMTPFQPTAKQKKQQAEIMQSLKQAETLLSQNNLTGAQQTADATVKLMDHSGPKFIFAPFVVNDLAPIYFRNEQYKRAASLYTQFASREVSLNADIALDNSGQSAKARRQYRVEQFLVRHKEFKSYLPSTATPEGFSATLFLWRGIIDVDEDHPENALWALHHALKLIPNNPLALWYYGEALSNDGRIAEARSYLRAAVAHDHGFVAQKAQARLNRPK